MSISTTKTAGAAVKTFPILLKWGLATRPAVSCYHIGGSRHAQKAPRAAAFSDKEKRACVADNVATLYHDLGVVAFDGCSYEQSHRMGNILAKAVALGVRTRAAAVSEERALEAFEVFPALWRLEEETWGHRVE